MDKPLRQKFEDRFELLLQLIAKLAEHGEPMPEDDAGNHLRRLFMECGVTGDDLADIELQKNALLRLADALREARMGG